VGDTVVLKPSPFTPLTVLRAADYIRELLPPGVLNVITGGDRLGPWMTAHPGFNQIAFTGSTQTGRRVLGSAAETLKHVTLELGGNDPGIVLPDADPQAIAEPLFWSMFLLNGQACIGLKRLFVHEDVYDALNGHSPSNFRLYLEISPATQGLLYVSDYKKGPQRSRWRVLVWKNPPNKFEIEAPARLRHSGILAGLRCRALRGFLDWPALSP
jgi:hypothetical protein